jgi:hypothetical protein
MLSFAMPDFRGIPTLAETIALPGKLTAKEEDGVSAAALEQLATLLPHVKPYTPQKIPSRYLAPFSDRLLVYSAIDVSGRRGPLGWNPLPGDRANVDGTVAAWMTLPWGAPAQLILPGFSTPAESSLKRGGTGDELFLASCGLLAAGSRTVLLSRWRVGGKSTYGLINEFAQELPHLAPPNAWQRAVQLTRVAELDPTSEPRVNRSTFSEATTLDHPFFWAGYLLIDQSQLAPGEAPPALVCPICSPTEPCPSTERWHPAERWRPMANWSQAWPWKRRMKPRWPKSWKRRTMTLPSHQDSKTFGSRWKPVCSIRWPSSPAGPYVAVNVLTRSMAMVSSPTPPGTGVR